MFDVPSSLRSLADQVDGWLDLRCPERALELIDPILADPIARPAALVMRVRALARQGNYRDALRDLTELQTTHAGDDWVDLTEAWCRKRTGDLPGAIRCAEQLVARNHKCDIGHFNLACYLALSGQIARAVDAVTIACGLNDECRDFARDEPDLDSLRADPGFRQLMREAPTGDAGSELADDEFDDDGGGGDPHHN